MAKHLHETQRLSFDGAVDADGHILEPPDLWETYLEPKYRDRALRFVRDENGLEELEIGGERSRMSRRGFRRRSARWATPICGRCSSIPSARISARRRSAAWSTTNGFKVLDAEGIDAAVLYTTVGLLWEAELEDAELSQAYTRAYNRWICEFCAGSDRLIPTAHLSLSDPVAAARELERAVGTPAQPLTSPFHPTAGRSVTPTTIRSSRPRRISTCPSPSIPRSSRSGPRARAWVRGRT